MAEEYKQAIIVRADLKLPKGKLAGQVAHAAVEAVIETQQKDKAKVSAWREQGQKKVVLKVKDDKELFKLKHQAHEFGLVCAVITDAGKTVLEPGTVTCMALGPDTDEKIDYIAGKLKLL